MRKLYWGECEKCDYEEISRLLEKDPRFSPIIGLCLSLKETTITGVGEDGLIGSGVKIEGKDFEKNRLFVFRMFEDGWREKDTDKSVPIITGGADFFKLSRSTFYEWSSEINKREWLTVTEDGKQAGVWYLMPLFVVPFYNGTLDEHFDKWEMFEEEGFIYGKDTRTGEIHELKHLAIVNDRFPSQGDQEILWDMFVISNTEILNDDGKEDIYGYLEKLPAFYAKGRDAEWAKALSYSRFQYIGYSAKGYREKKQLSDVVRVELRDED